MSRMAFVTVIIVGLLSSISFSYCGGTGEPNNPYQICSIGDLLAMAANTADYNKCFILTADIYLGGTFTTAVIAPDMDNTNLVFDGVPFTGVFDGNNHRITNLTIHTNSNSFTGLFGCIGSNGSVKNLGIGNCDVNGNCYIGGLVGENDGNISNCSATGTVSGYAVDSDEINRTSVNVGGLVGYNHNGNISNCSTVISMPEERSAVVVGGLVGYSDGGSIIHCSSTGSVGCWYSGAGGLVGENDGNISDCSSAGTVYSLQSVGGLVGYNSSGNISDCCSTSNVSGGYNLGGAGGLVGSNYSGNISNCCSMGIVNGGMFWIGGLVGSNGSGNIGNSYSTSPVSGFEWVGGLVGSNDSGGISHCYSIGLINGSDFVGGLIGSNGIGNITDCRSPGIVGGNVHVGGLVGYNHSGNISYCCSTGSVRGPSDSNYVSNYMGGLVGWNDSGDISDCYSTSAVNSPYGSDVGGLVGYDGGGISYCYSTGSVSGSNYVGGLVGYDGISNCASIVYSFWDIYTSGQTTSARGEGKTTAEMQNINTFLSAGWDFVNIWQMPVGGGYPILSVFNGPILIVTASHPRPADGVTSGLYIGEAPDVNLMWYPGIFAADVNGHDVYFGMDFNDVNNANISNPMGVYKGRQSTTTWLASGLEAGDTYYWRIDEVNNTNIWRGPIWSFTTGLIIDDFERYNSTADLQAKWATTYLPNPAGFCADSPGVPVTNGAVTFVCNDRGKYMQFHYYDTSGLGDLFFSEARYEYDSNGVDWTVGQSNVLAISYKGAICNYVDQDYDRMYLAIQDTAGNIGIVQNPDGNAAQVGNWTQWYIALNDISAAGTPHPVNLHDVNAFYLGFGQRCNYWMPGNDGNVMFDNIRLYARVCNPVFGPKADLNGDCDVDIKDLDIFADDWLLHAETRTFNITQPPKAPVLWYKFDDSGNTTDVIDYGTGYYIGTVANWRLLNWDNSGGRNGNGCLYLPQGTGSYVAAPPEALSFMSDDDHIADGGGVTFSVWINADMTAYYTFSAESELFSVWDEPFVHETMGVRCPSPWPPADQSGPAAKFIKSSPPVTVATGPRPMLDFGGRWNHYAFVKEPNQMLIYLNGQVVADLNSLDNANVSGPLFASPAGAFYIGVGVDPWGLWAGRIQDFQVYDYALSDQEVAWLATDGTGQLLIPLISRANLKNDGLPQNQIVNFGDLAVMASEWRTIQMWP